MTDFPFSIARADGNQRERLWMGYERKRGKLSELNAFLRGSAKDRFALVSARRNILSSVKYVITLDTDTQLPRDFGLAVCGRHGASV